MKALHLLLTGTLLWAGISHPAQSAETSSKNDDVAIIIGNKSYVDSDIPEVSFAHNDAKAMRYFAENVLQIRSENIVYLEDATQAKMQSAFGRRGNHRGKAFQYVKPGISNLYVFYSGHGVPGQRDNKSYLLPVDAEIETADINGYPTDVLYNNLRQVDAKSVTVFLDACFSGNSHGGTLLKRASGASILPSAMPQTTSKKDKLTVLTAASKDQLASWDEENEHGLFTEYLLRALYGEADKNNDGKVVLNEISAFLNEDMRYKARRTYNRDQTPTVMGDNGQVMVAAIDGIYPTRPEDLDRQDNEDDVPVDPPTIDTSDFELYPVEANMFALKNANVRAKPTVRSRRVMTLPKGEPIHVAAKIIDEPWYAVERGDGIIGYVFADLLGEEKEIATEEENRSIRELKARLEKLEEQTRLSSKDILPQPPETTTHKDEPVIVEMPEMENLDDMDQAIEETWTVNIDDPFEEIQTTLKSMGAILARQSFIIPHRLNGQKTSFAYNWIRVDADRCQIRASISLNHDDRFKKNIRIHDRQIQAVFWQELRSKKRKLFTYNLDGNVDRKITIYQYGPFPFKEKKDRRRFIAKTKHLMKICPMPYQARQDEAYEQFPREYDKQPRDFRRPPPPPRRRPPPPRR